MLFYLNSTLFDSFKRNVPPINVESIYYIIIVQQIDVVVKYCIFKID